MADSRQGLLEFLEGLRREREELDLLISGLERRLGIVSEKGIGETAEDIAPRVSVRVDSIPIGYFHNLSQSEAAEKLLRLKPSQALKTIEIVDALRKSGMELNPKFAVTTMFTALTRSPKFARVAGKAWGLKEWYGPEKRHRKEGREDQEQQVKDKG